jgi:hypothetical protein
MEHLPEIVFILVRLFFLACLGLGLARVSMWAREQFSRGTGRGRWRR